MATMTANDTALSIEESLSLEEKAKIEAALDFYLAEIACMQRESQAAQTRMVVNFAETRAIIVQINAMLPIR